MLNKIKYNEKYTLGYHVYQYFVSPPLFNDETLVMKPLRLKVSKSPNKRVNDMSDLRWLLDSLLGENWKIIKYNDDEIKDYIVLDIEINYNL